jgi:SAM-dependent methyltransferase
MFAIETNPDLPEYAAELDIRHRAHAKELRQMIADLAVLPGQRVLDVACGDGFFSSILAERVGSAGSVVGIDASPAYLEIARQRLATCLETRIELIVAHIESPPFPDESFDFIWCAKSLVSVAQPETAIRQMVRLLRPGGQLAILENDSMHEILLSWPEDLELAIRQAELAAYREQTRRPDKRYIARRLPPLLADAGLLHSRRKTYAIDRNSPLCDEERKCLFHYLNGLRAKIYSLLNSKHRIQFDRLTDCEYVDAMTSQNGFGMSWLEVVCSGQKRS